MKLPFSSLTSVLRILTMYLLRSCNEEPLYETIICVGSPGFVCKKKILTSAKLRSSCYKKIYLLKLKLSVHLCANFLFSSIILTSVWQGMIFLSQPQNESLKGPPRLGLWRKKEDSKNGWGSRQGLTHVNVLFVTTGIFLG